MCVWRTKIILSCLLGFVVSSLTALTRRERCEQLTSPSLDVSQISSPWAVYRTRESSFLIECIWRTLLRGFDCIRDSPRLQHAYDPWTVFCILFLAACHSSCLTCLGPERAHCVRCKKPGEGLQVERLPGANVTSGECVSQCRAQFYLESTGLCEGEQAWVEEMWGSFWALRLRDPVRWEQSQKTFVFT